MTPLRRLAAWCGAVLAGGESAPACDAAMAALISRHRVGPWLYDALAHAPGFAASEWAPLLRSAAVTSLAQTAFDDRVRREVLGVLAGAGAAPVPLKGTVFGRVLYRAPHLRPSHDLDVWVAPGDSLRAETALLAAGYRAAERGKGRHIEAMSHERAYWRGSDLPVELHANITQPQRFAVDPGELAAALEPFTFDGVSVRRFDDRVQAAHVIVHAAHHKFAVPLIHWVDLCLLLERVPAREVAELCRRWDAGHALWVAAETLDVAFGKPALRRACARPPAPVRLALSHAKPRNGEASALREHWLGWWLMQGAGRRVRFAVEYGWRAALDAASGYSSRQSRSNWGWRSKRRVRLAGSSAWSSGRSASPQASQ